ncbi:hypothetical protein GCM10023165_52240 [Variovorax defluvii]|uniref:Uncharacterized protein n=1 Tax=Variovorax defluvii TaxID=913761 RepID=A0ABP8IFV9_9BURK
MKHQSSSYLYDRSRNRPWQAVSISGVSYDYKTWRREYKHQQLTPAAAGQWTAKFLNERNTEGFEAVRQTMEEQDPPISELDWSGQRLTLAAEKDPDSVEARDSGTIGSCIAKLAGLART